MDPLRRAPILALGLTLFAAALVFAGQGRAPTIRDLTPSEMEAFLLNAKITDIRDAGIGITESQRATLTDGTLTHDAHIQSVDIRKPIYETSQYSEINFRDTYRFNIAGYRLAQLLGITTVPMSVERDVNRKTSSVTWWVDDVQMDERERLKRKTSGPDPTRTSNQLQRMYVWDELIQNRDRNQGNVLWTNDWTLWLIDHTLFEERAASVGEAAVFID